MIILDLDPFEARVLGVLAEKQVLTPDAYPLSLNAVCNGANQLSNREPVMSVSESTIEACLRRLQENNLASQYYPAGSRVAKYVHKLSEVFSLDDAKLAIVIMLLLRGPQTTGELRGRTARMYPFASVDSVEHALNALASHDPPLAKSLPRAPGTKEPRWAHLLSGEMALERAEHMAGMAMGHTGVVEAAPSHDRVAELEAEVAELKRLVNGLVDDFAQFKRQFE